MTQSLAHGLLAYCSNLVSVAAHGLLHLASLPESASDLWRPWRSDGTLPTGSFSCHSPCRFRGWVVVANNPAASFFRPVLLLVLLDALESLRSSWERTLKRFYPLLFGDYCALHCCQPRCQNHIYTHPVGSAATDDPNWFRFDVACANVHVANIRKLIVLRHSHGLQ